MKIGSGNGLVPSRHRAITWVSGDPDQWCICVTVLGKYIDAEKNGTIWAHEGYLHPCSWKWAIPTRQVGSGRGTGWPWFVKSPILIVKNHLMTGLLLFHGIVQATFLSGSLLEQQIYQMGRLASLVSLEQADLFSKKGDCKISGWQQSRRPEWSIALDPCLIYVSSDEGMAAGRATSMEWSTAGTVDCFPACMLPSSDYTIHVS